MFLIHTVDAGYIPSSEYLPKGSVTPAIGIPLKLSSGVLAACLATDKPEYICICSKATAGGDLAVLRVEPGIVFATTNTASFSSITLGTRVQLGTSTNAGKVTNTAEAPAQGQTPAVEAHAEVIYKEADAAGSVIHVRFN